MRTLPCAPPVSTRMLLFLLGQILPVGGTWMCLWLALYTEQHPVQVDRAVHTPHVQNFGRSRPLTLT